MADIFISYSKADRDLAVKISTFLEAEGWSVWWDKSLAAGDSYRDEIMRQLASARAVITLWTENSIRSDWVRAEAGRAKADGKLIPVKAPALTYADIPLPFGEMHTENTSALDLIRAAVVAQLARPATQPSTVWRATKAARLHLLTWTGIVGGAITLFANARDVLNLADWVRWVVTYWQDWTHAIWAWVFAWIGVQVPRAYVPLLSFAAFTAMLVAGTRLRGAQSANVQTTVRSDLWRFCRLLGLYAAYAVFLLVVWIVALAIADRISPTAAATMSRSRTFLIVGLSLVTLPPALYAIYAARERTQAAVSSLLFFGLGVMLVVGSLLSMLLRGQVDTSVFVNVAIAYVPFALEIGLFAVISFAPLRAVNRRLLFIVLGVVVLASLNEISKLGLQQYIVAPKPPG